jgi:hypothetical protein
MFVEIWRSLQKKADSDLDEKINEHEWVRFKTPHHAIRGKHLPIAKQHLHKIDHNF